MGMDILMAIFILPLRAFYYRLVSKDQINDCASFLEEFRNLRRPF